MSRLFALAAVVAGTSGLTGCASTWDDVLSRRFRDKPFAVMFKSEDPLQVLRTNPDGAEQARAMRRLKEPAANGRPEAEQDEVVQLLTKAATSDPSPWVRIAAIDALGRFKDPRGAEVLVAAYHQAAGRSTAEAANPTPVPVIQVSGGRQLSENPLLRDRLGLHGPEGFPADQVATIRGRAVDALARTNRPEAVTFLARVATGQDTPPPDEDPASRDFVRQRAVAGLGQVRQKESVVVLAKVLAAERGKDLTLTNLAHGGLVGLTGKNYPPEPEKWDAVVQAGFEIAPEPNAVQRAIGIEIP